MFSFLCLSSFFAVRRQSIHSIFTTFRYTIFYSRDFYFIVDWEMAFEHFICIRFSFLFAQLIFLFAVAMLTFVVIFLQFFCVDLSVVVALRLASFFLCCCFVKRQHTKFLRFFLLAVWFDFIFTSIVSHLLCDVEVAGECNKSSYVVKISNKEICYLR